MQERSEAADADRPGPGCPRAASRRPQQARPAARSSLRSRRAPPAARPAQQASPPSRPRIRGRPLRASTRSRGACAATAPGTASRTSARSCRTRSRRPTSWPTPPTRRRRQADRRAGRRAVPGPLPGPAGRGARAGRPGRGGRRLPREADPPPPARVRRGRGGDGRATVVSNWGRIKREDERGGEVFGDLPENLPSHAVREQGPAPGRERGAEDERSAPGARRCRDGSFELDTARPFQRWSRSGMPRRRRRLPSSPCGGAADRVRGWRAIEGPQ